MGAGSPGVASGWIIPAQPEVWYAGAMKSPEQQALAEMLGHAKPGPAAKTPAPATSATSEPEAFSWNWTLLSVLIFGVAQVGLGFLAGEYLFTGRYLTENMRFFVEGSINLASYFLSGLLIGVISPRVRLLEPAIGAAIVVVATLSVGLFTPNRLLGMGPMKLLIGGGLAFMLALWGAWIGERFTRQVR